MYSIYLYCEDSFRKSEVMQYGYWCGKSYAMYENTFPVCKQRGEERKIKWYKHLKRAINAGESAIQKYTYVIGYDIDDEQGNTIYESHMPKYSSRKKSPSKIGDKEDEKPENTDIAQQPHTSKIILGDLLEILPPDTRISLFVGKNEVCNDIRIYQYVNMENTYSDLQVESMEPLNYNRIDIYLHSETREEK